MRSFRKLEERARGGNLDDFITEATFQERVDILYVASAMGNLKTCQSLVLSDAALVKGTTSLSEERRLPLQKGDARQLETDSDAIDDVSSGDDVNSDDDVSDDVDSDDDARGVLRHGESALHGAIRMGQYDVCEFLIKNGADVLFANKLHGDIADHMTGRDTDQRLLALVLDDFQKWSRQICQTRAERYVNARHVDQLSYFADDCVWADIGEAVERQSRHASAISNE